MHVPCQVLPWASGAKRTDPTGPTGWPHNVGTREGSLSPGPFWGVQWACAGPTIPPSLITGCGACSELSLTLGGPRGATASCRGGPCKREGCLLGAQAAEASWSNGYLSGVFKDEEEFPDGDGGAGGPVGKSDITGAGAGYEDIWEPQICFLLGSFAPKIFTSSSRENVRGKSFLVLTLPSLTP